MSLTREQWAAIDKKLDRFWSPVRLRVDDYDVTLQLERVSQFENEIVVWVNGQWKGEWMLNDCEERRRFYRPKKLRNTFLDRAKKKLGKRHAARLLKGMPTHHVSYCFGWKSFRALKRHLIANNQSIELIEEIPV